MPKVSIIIPCYNVEKFLSNMISAVEAQTLQDYEVLMIDDGSQDNTALIMEEQSKKDGRFRCFSQQNQGVSVARNRGLELAKGDFVAFYDADDFVPETALQKMVEAAELQQADLAVGKFRITRLNGSKLVKATVRLSGKAEISRFDTDLLWNFSVCNKLFRRKSIEEMHLRFDPVLKITEDGFFLMQFVHKCKKITGVPVVAYDYRKRPFWEDSSATQRISKELLNNVYKAFRALEKLVVENTKTDCLAAGHIHGDERQEICERLTYRATLYKRFVKSDFLADYYKKVWSSAEDLSGELKEYVDYCKQKMFPDMWTQLVKQNFELCLEDGIRSRKEIAEEPTITILLKKGLPLESVDGVLNSCYRQEMPFFEILADPQLKSAVKSIYQQKENFHFLDSDNWIRQVKGEFAMVIDESIWLMENTLREMLKAMKMNRLVQSVSVPVMQMQEEKLIPTEHFRETRKNKKITANMLFRAGFLAYEKTERINWFEEQQEIESYVVLAP